jgi:multiple sugar transport system substrate-binding protein
MAIAGSWLTRDMKDKARFPFDFRVGIAYLPRYDRNTASRIVDMSVSTIGIPANSKHKDEAWEFIKYYVTKHSSVIAESGNVPCYIPAWTNDVVDIYVKGSGLSVEDGRKFFDPTATILSAFPIGPKNTQYLQILNEEVTLYFNGERSLEQITSSIESKYKALK